ncbi:MAG: NAD(+)/NADH kinase [bacterium]
MNKKRVCIITDLKKKKSKAVALQLSDWLKKHKAEVSINPKDPRVLKASNVLMGLGGDGTILQVARIAAPLGKPVLGINLGSLGFLAETDPYQMYDMIDRVLSDQYKIENRVLIEAKVLRKNKIVGSFTALNEAVIRNGETARVITLELEVDKQYVATYVGDGLIASTPTGSTAYSLAASGPILYPTLPVIALCAICPHTLAQRPVIVSDSSIIKIDVKSNHNEVILTLDGQNSMVLGINDVVKITKAPYMLKLIKVPGKSYFEVLRTKLKWGKR